EADKLVPESLGQLLHPFRFGEAIWPFLERPERRKEFRNEGAIRVSCIFAAPLLGHYCLDRGVAGVHLTNLVNGLASGIQRDRGGKQGADPEIAFCQFWKKFGAEPHAKRATDH